MVNKHDTEQCKCKCGDSANQEFKGYLDPPNCFCSHNKGSKNKFKKI